MKFFAFALLAACLSQAAPRIDMAVGTENVFLLTILPDHEDPNLYYFFPNSYRIASANGRLQFAYYETSGFTGVTQARASLTVKAHYDFDNLNMKIAEIKAENPNARFTPVAVLSSELRQMGTKTHPFINGVHCQPEGNLLGMDVGCELDINVRNRSVFINVIRRNLANVIALTYSFTAVVEGKHRTINHSLPVLFSEVGIGDYFFDSQGRPIPDPLYEEYKKLIVEKDQYYNKYLKPFADDLKKLKKILSLCSGVRSSDECFVKLKGSDVESRYALIVRRRPSDPHSFILEEIQMAEDQFKNKRWLGLLQKIDELKKRLNLS